MSTSAHTERLFIDGPAGQLEAILELAGERTPVGCVVICHPHPQHGGTMQNKVVFTLARAFTRMGFAALRFNFRGTGKSEGVYDAGNGELEDTLAAIEWMRAKAWQGPCWVAGFSFGAAIVVKVATVTLVDGLVSVAPAISHFASELAVSPECPWLLVQGDQDEIVDVTETIAWVDELTPRPKLLLMKGAEHFFHGRLIELRDAVENFVGISTPEQS